VTPAPRRIAYGWYVVAALFVVLTITSGLAFYNMSVYMSALVATHGFPVSAVSAAIAVFFIASGFGGLAAGHLLTRVDPRWTIVAGGVLGALSLWLLGGVTALWQLYLVYVLFGLGHACCALVPATTLVTRWFTEKRSIALSVASTGLSLGGILLTPASAALIGRIGLEAATDVFALIWFLGVVPVTVLVIREAPSAPIDAGVGTAARAAAAPQPPLDGWRYADALPSRWFLAITGAWVLIMLAQVGAISHLFNLASTRVDAATGATAVSLMASTSILGRFLGGWLITRFDGRMFALVCIVLQGVALSSLAFAEGRSGVLLAAVAFGATVGNLLMLQPLLLAEVFGARDYSRIYSLSQLVTTLGVASGPALLGVLFDLLGGYEASFLLAGTASVAALVAMVVAGPFPAGPPVHDADADHMTEETT
jgi:MFS family permease